MNEKTPVPDPEAAQAAKLFAAGLSPTGSGPARVQAPSPQEIAPLFPNLEILEVLGQGGMGVVYRARQPRLERLVALKVLYRELADDPAFAERFEREARALAKLDHPHIVRVYDFGVTEGLYWLLLEHVDGASLRQLIDAGEMSPRDALAVVPQICEALQYAHDHGVVHRDIKPENVLLDEAGRVKIADFGLAKLVQADAAPPTLTGTHQVMGTWQYMAPEQYKSPQEVDHRADIYSLGVVFYEMLTGDLPVGNVKQPSETRALDRRIDAIVMRTLEREREARYQQAEEVRRDVVAVDADEAARPARTRAAAPPASAPTSPRPKPGWLLAASFLMVPIGITALEWMRRAAQAGPYEEAAAWWSKAQVFTSVLWIAGIVFALMAIKHAITTGGRVVASLLIVGLVAMLGVVWIGSRSTTWGAITRQQTTTQVDKRQLWLDDIRSRYTAGAPLPDVQVPGGSANQALADQVLGGVLKLWQRFAWREDVDGSFSALETPGFYDDDTADQIRKLAPSVFEEKRDALELGIAFATETQLGMRHRDLYVRSIRLDPRYERADVELAPRDGARPLVVRFPAVKGKHAGDWRFATGRVSILGPE